MENTQANLLKVTLLNGCFSQFLNCTNQIAQNITFGSWLYQVHQQMVKLYALSTVKFLSIFSCPRISLNETLKEHDVFLFCFCFFFFRKKHHLFNIFTYIASINDIMFLTVRGSTGSRKIK